MITAEFLDQLSRFSLIVHKRVTSNYAGPRRSVTHGRGITFKDHRMYSPGDDFRSIDWKVFARTDDLYIKNFEEDRNLIVHVIIDNSASMNFRSNKFTKFEYASMLGIGFAYLTLRENGKLQFATFADKMTVFSSRKGKSHIMAMLDYLNTLKQGKASDFSGCMLRYKKYISSRSLIVIISDFLYDQSQIEIPLYLFGGHNIKLVQVLDPMELNMEGIEGDYNLQDLETDESMRTYISRKMRNEYKSKLHEHNAKIKELCDKTGVDFYTLSTDKSIFDSFYEVLR